MMALVNSDEDLSILAKYDELMQAFKLQRCNDVKDKFLDFVVQVKGVFNHFYECQQECQQLNKELEKKTQECCDLENKLGVARRFLDQERRQSRKILEERDALEEKIARVADFLLNSNQNSLSDEVRQQLAVFKRNRLDKNGQMCGVPQLSASSHDVNTTGSPLSDLSYSREDDLDMSTVQCKTWKKHRPSMEPSEKPAIKNRRSGGAKVVEINATDTVTATTTFTVTKDGVITATSVIKSIPPEPSAPTHSPLKKQGVIGDYTPAIPPMVPPLIVHCIKEIESRGLNEIGIYRKPGSKKDVKALKERFLRGEGVPCLSDADIHVVCCTVKNFLRSLHEPLIPHARCADVVRAVESKDKMDIGPILYQIISELPQPNQDTLAYMILHLKQVASSPDCKMPVVNLARLFGPTIVGYSSANLNPAALFIETENQRMVMENLINLPNDYWESFVNTNKSEKPAHHTSANSKY